MTLVQGLKVLDVARRMIDGSIIDKVQAARELVSMALDMVPEDEIHAYLTDAARVRADAVADAYEADKLAGQ